MALRRAPLLGDPGVQALRALPSRTRRVVNQEAWRLCMGNYAAWQRLRMWIADEMRGEPTRLVEALDAVRARGGIFIRHPSREAR